MYEELIEAVKKDLSSSSKEELLDMVAQLYAAYIISLYNTSTDIVGGDKISPNTINDKPKKKE